MLYANKCSKRDEIYRQRIQLSEKKTDTELINFLKLSKFVSDHCVRHRFRLICDDHLVFIFYLFFFFGCNCSKYLLLIKEAEFSKAIITLQAVKEKFCPREMLNLIEETFKHVETAAEIVSKCSASHDRGDGDRDDNGNDCNSTNSAAPEATPMAPPVQLQLNADNMMPLTIFLILRAGIPHLGTEILL